MVQWLTGHSQCRGKAWVLFLLAVRHHAHIHTKNPLPPPKKKKNSKERIFNEEISGTLAGDSRGFGASCEFRKQRFLASLKSHLIAYPQTPRFPASWFLFAEGLVITQEHSWLLGTIRALYSQESCRGWCFTSLRMGGCELGTRSTSLLELPPPGPGRMRSALGGAF